MTSSYPYALSFQRYRDLLGQDAARLLELAEAARDLDVPECPGWTGEDVVFHTAEVYLHKSEAIRTGAMPREGWPPVTLRDVDAIARLEDSYRRLTEQFDAHSPSDPADTWAPGDHTVGFWIRRMAHETAVHRRDIESAVGQPTAVAADLAVDGIDEVLDLFLGGDWSDEVQDGASGRTVAVDSGGHVWAVTLEPGRVRFDRNEQGDPAARVSGEPSDVLLWLWGRGEVPNADGDPAAVTELRERLSLATR